MPVIDNGGRAHIVRLQLKWTEFPGYLERLWQPDSPTARLERYGAQYVADDFPLDRTLEFVTKVCGWGNYPGVAGKVKKHNARPFVRSRLRHAYLAQKSGNIRDAILAVTDIKGLAVSFGSKHLKFLDPRRAVVLDSIISERLGYPRDAGGYVEFVQDCHSIRAILNAKGIAASSHRKTWRVSDVEMAIYMFLIQSPAGKTPAT